MKNKLFSFVFCIVLACVFAGCGPSKEEGDAKERQRLQLEEQAQRDIQKSNEAVNEVSKKLGRKPPTLDLGVPAQTQTVPATPPPATTTPKP